MQEVVRHAARQFPAWLIFDVGQIMKVMHLLWAISLVALKCTAATQQGLPSERATVSGFSVSVPGEGWAMIRREGLVQFGKMHGAAVSHMAELSVRTLPAPVSHTEFIDSVQRRLRSENGRYKILKADMIEDDRDGAWRVICRLDCEDSGAVNAGTHGALVLRSAYVVTLLPAESRIITVSYSSRGPHIEKRAFEEQSQKFLASFQREGDKPNKAPEPTPGTVTPRAKE